MKKNFFVSGFFLFFSAIKVFAVQIDSLDAKVVVTQQKGNIFENILFYFVIVFFFVGLFFCLKAFFSLRKIKNYEESITSFFYFKSKLKPIWINFLIIIFIGLFSFLTDLLIMFFESFKKIQTPIFMLLNVEQIGRVLKTSVFCGIILILIYLFFEQWLEKRFKVLLKK